VSSASRSTIRNFGGGGCSDGVQVESAGIQIGPGNEFMDIPQDACDNINGYDAHADTVQCGGLGG
jgi:hypothetical protein